MARRSPGAPSKTNSNVPVRRQAGGGRRLGGPFAQSRHVLAALRADPSLAPAKRHRGAGCFAGRRSGQKRSGQKIVAFDSGHQRSCTLPMMYFSGT